MKTKQDGISSRPSAIEFRSYERSFPAGSVVGEAWILDVVEDLELFAESRRMLKAAAILHQTKSDLSYLSN